MERPFPPLYACQPIVLGVMWLDQDLACKRIGTFGEAKDEAGMMSDFAEFMGKWTPHLVTWNGRGFRLVEAPATNANPALRCLFLWLCASCIDDLVRHVTTGGNAHQGQECGRH